MEEAILEGRRVVISSDDDLIASFAFLNAGPPYNAPPNFYMHLLPEVVGFCQAGRDFLCTDVFSERFRDGMCTSIPPPPGSDDDDPVASHYTEKEKMSTEIPTWWREWRRRMISLRCNVDMDRMKETIFKHKEFILNEMCEKEADRRNLIRQSADDLLPTIDKPTSVKWRFFEMTRSASPGHNLEVTFQDDPSFTPEDESMAESMERATPSTRKFFSKMQSFEKGLMRISSERWRGNIQMVTKSIPADGLRPDLETPPGVSISPNTGIYPNELLTLEEEARRIFAKNRNNDQYRRDNETFSVKKSLLSKFLEEREASRQTQRQEIAENQPNEPSSVASNSSRPVFTSTVSQREASRQTQRQEIAENQLNEPSFGASNSSRLVFTSTVSHYELFRIKEEEEERRIYRENREDGRYQQLVEDQMRHIKTLQEFLYIVFWHYCNYPNYVSSIESLIECINKEKKLLESFQSNR